MEWPRPTFTGLERLNAVIGQDLYGSGSGASIHAAAEIGAREYSRSKPPSSGDR
jgi:hypothetical protein